MQTISNKNGPPLYFIPFPTQNEIENNTAKNKMYPN